MPVVLKEISRLYPKPTVRRGNSFLDFNIETASHFMHPGG
jgi:hypothetical protein